MNHPIDISPLARKSEKDPSRAERFELYIGGKEIANGFSELNDPKEQAMRMLAQARQRIPEMMRRCILMKITLKL